MPLVSGATAPQFTLPHATFTGLASPSRGSSESSVWRVTIAAGAGPAPHTLSREEIFVALSGAAVATIGSDTFAVAAGDTLVVPPGVLFSLANPHSEPFEAVCVLPVGGTACLPDGAPFVPPWAA